MRPVEESKPLVIPLIEKNRWRVPKPEDLEKPDNKPCAESNKNEIKVISTGDKITDKAVAEILSGINCFPLITGLFLFFSDMGKMYVSSYTLSYQLVQTACNNYFLKCPN